MDAEIGHNSSVDDAQLRAFFERIERLKEEQKSLSQDVASIYGEARSAGYDAKAMREVVKLRGMDRDKRMEHEALVELYRSAVGLS
jgi:uncharacterized protein (UPF0335 family)